MKIKRCPFCGHKSNLMQQYNDRLKTYFLRVECPMCGARGGTTSTKYDARDGDWKENNYCKKAVALWNNRKPMEILRKWVHDWTYPDANGDFTECYIGDLDYIIDNIYYEEETENYYGKLV